MSSKKSSTTEHSPKGSKSTASTQRYLPISEIHNNTLIMKDGTLRAALLVSSVNFFLKSEEEQNAIVQGYQQFLNSIDFPFQILIQSRKFDAAKYLSKLEKLERQQMNDLLKLQMADYRQFVGELIDMSQIMDKKFYVIIPYDPLSDTKRGFFQQLGAVFTPTGEIRLKHEQFLQRKHFLDLRVQSVASSLKSMDLNTVLLDTQSLIELLYNTYNQDISGHEKMVDVNKLMVEE